MKDLFDYELSNDAPKVHRNEDQLGYAPFAERLASVIKRVDVSNGYVIGVHGKWGSGKSTTLNFVVERIKEFNQAIEADDRADKKSLIRHVDFRPWLITGHQDLISAFLKVLSESLQESHSRRSRLLKKGLRWANESGVPGAIAKFAVTASVSMAGVASKPLGDVAGRSVSNAIGRFLRDPSLQKAHKEMKEQLAQSHQRVLVTVDDMDRLEAEEIRIIIRMVKSVGQLPNVVYLLFYDRDIVRKALDGASKNQGPSFAEKIVQQELELPKPRRGQLMKMLDEEAGFLIEETEPSGHWGRILGNGIRRWMRSPRDVVRLCNAVKFSWSALEHEIDPQDLFAMDGLRLFDAEAFNWIRDNRSLLFCKDRFLLEEEDSLKSVVGQLKDTVAEAKRSQVIELVATLFPQLAEFLFEPEEEFTVRNSEELVRNRGIGSEAGYDSYFGLYPSQDAVSLRKLNWLVSGADAQEIESSVREYLQKTDSSGESMIVGLLDEICARYRGQQATKPRQEMLDALFAAGEDIIAQDIKEKRTSFGIHPRQQLQVLTGLLLDLWGLSEAGKRLIESFRKTRSAAILADVFVSRGREMRVFDSVSDPQAPRISESDFKVLGEILLDKIQNAEADGTLHSAVYYVHILRSWEYLSSPDDPRRWVRKGIADNRTFMVKVCLGLVGYSDSPSERIYFMKEVPPEDLYDLSFLNEMARKYLEGADLTRDERNLIATVAEGTTKMIANGRSDVDS